MNLGSMGLSLILEIQLIWILVLFHNIILVLSIFFFICQKSGILFDNFIHMNNFNVLQSFKNF